MIETAAEVVEDSHISLNGTLSENCGTPSEKGLPQEVAVQCSGIDNDDGQSLLCHDLWRIALYYIYIAMTPAQVESHVDVQRRACEDLGLKGRIRVSHEGVNGVLSGKYEVLRRYEETITRALQEVCPIKDETKEQHKLREAVKGADSKTNDDSDKEDDDKSIVDLDVKYCELRTELPVEKQLFDRLIVKETKNVIGLFDQSVGQELGRQQQRSSRSERYRRRRERKRQEQEAKRKSKILDQPQPQVKQRCSSTDSKKFTNDEMSAETDGSDVAVDKQEIQSESKRLDMSSLYKSVMEEPLKPARHLSANEWNEKLDAVGSSDKSALLLDVRNVYEMKVGHFIHPSTPTLLTNTRKYSDLPKMLALNQEMQNRDQIFMYCTGGVRCERVSMLVHELYPEKEIFQLQGGIQRYLETCSKQNQKRKQNVDGINDSAKDNPGYFVGKNFVFDPRRTDPIHFGKTVGRCLICKTPHDDYDNGHASSENKEARCNNCRMLILICNDCRPKYRCHGEKGHDGNSSDDSCRPLLYCNFGSCIHEGSTPDPELRIAGK